MSQPYYGDRPQDPQDAARDAALSAGDAADCFDPGTPLPTRPSDMVAGTQWPRTRGAKQGYGTMIVSTITDSDVVIITPSREALEKFLEEYMPTMPCDADKFTRVEFKNLGKEDPT
jgi:hypothetical protein